MRRHFKHGNQSTSVTFTVEARDLLRHWGGEVLPEHPDGEDIKRAIEIGVKHYKIPEYARWAFVTPWDSDPVAVVEWSFFCGCDECWPSEHHSQNPSGRQGGFKSLYEWDTEDGAIEFRIGRYELIGKNDEKAKLSLQYRSHLHENAEEWMPAGSSLLQDVLAETVKKSR